MLAMQMPTTPAQLQNLTEEIRERVGDLGHVESILNQSAEDIQKAENLLEEARRARYVPSPLLLARSPLSILHLRHSRYDTEIYNSN